MPELIDRHALKNHLCRAQAEAFKRSEWYVAGAIQSFIDILDKQPTIEPEVRHGRWIDTPLPNSRAAKCSLCGFWQKTNGYDKTGKHLIHNAVYRYCAGCGAKMDGVSEYETD